VLMTPPLSAADQPYVVTGWPALGDGSHVGDGLSKDGSEDSIMHVSSVADGRGTCRAASPTPQAADPSGSMTLRLLL